MCRYCLALSPNKANYCYSCGSIISDKKDVENDTKEKEQMPILDSKGVF